MAEIAVLRAPALLTPDAIATRVAPLLQTHGATAAFLIGSYAQAAADAWSDVDLVVVMPTSAPFVERPLQLVDVLDAFPVAVDLLVYTPAEWAAGLQRNLGIFHTVATQGVRIL